MRGTGEQRQYWGTGNIRKQFFEFWGTGEQGNLFQGNKGTGTPLGGPHNCQLFSKLFISCQSRECDPQDFLNHENQSFPASLSDDEMLPTSQKSQRVPIFEAKAALPNVLPSIEVINIDGSALVNDNQPRTSK